MVRSLAKLLLLRGAGLLAATATGIVLARWLGPAGRGELAALWSLASAVSVLFQGGCPEASVVLLGSAATVRDRGQIVYSSVVVAFILSLVAGMGTAACIQWILPDQARQWPLGAMLAAVPLIGVFLRHIVLATHGEVSFSKCQQVESVTLLLVVAAIAASLSPTVASGATAYLLASSAALLLPTAMIYRHFPIREGAFEMVAPHVAWRLLRNGAPFALIGTASTICQRSTVITLAASCGGEEAGQFVVAAALQSIIAIIPSQAGTIVFVRATQQFGESHAPTTLLRMLLVGTAATMAGALALSLFASPLLNHLYGESYAHSVALVRILAVAALAQGAITILTNAMIGRGLPRGAIFAALTSLGTLLVVLYPMTMAFGAAGAAWAQVCAAATGLLVISVFVYRSRDHWNAEVGTPSTSRRVASHDA